MLKFIQATIKPSMNKLLGNPSELRTLMVSRRTRRVKFIRTVVVVVGCWVGGRLWGGVMLTQQKLRP